MSTPSPLVPASVDCTDLDGFMLNVERLMASELVALSSHEVIGAALLLWCRAWKQRPAASLPNDDKVISAFARMPLARFRKLRSEVLRGFVLCSDGRLYHTTLAREAINAFERKTAFQRKREADAERLRKWRSGSKYETPHETPSETPSETRFIAEGQGQGQGQGQKKEESEENVGRPLRARALDGEKPEDPQPPPSPAGAACLAMRMAGLQATNPGDPRLLALLAQGATEPELVGIAAEAAAKGKGWAWCLVTLEARRREAAAIALAPVVPDAAEVARQAAQRAEDERKAEERRRDAELRSPEGRARADAARVAAMASVAIRRTAA